MSSPFGQPAAAKLTWATEQQPKDIPWVEKYRPAKIDDVAQQDEVVSSLKNSLETGDLPNLLLYGPPGTGKTSVALAVCHQFFGTDFKSRVKEMNASDERGISAIREQVKVFAQLAVGSGSSNSKYKFRIVILDEADSMTHDAQAALRRIMEEVCASDEVYHHLQLCLQNHRASSFTLFQVQIQANRSGIPEAETFPHLQGGEGANQRRGSGNPHHFVQGGHALRRHNASDSCEFLWRC